MIVSPCKNNFLNVDCGHSYFFSVKELLMNILYSQWFYLCYTLGSPSFSIELEAYLLFNSKAEILF